MLLSDTPYATNSVRFNGTLDTKTLGGAGFASQMTMATGRKETGENFPVVGGGERGGLVDGMGRMGVGRGVGGRGIGGQNVIRGVDAEVGGELDGREKEDDDGQDTELQWNLTQYSGLEIHVLQSDAKIYTFILKDGNSLNIPTPRSDGTATPGKREAGRIPASINWEVDFRVPGCDHSPTQNEAEDTVPNENILVLQPEEAGSGKVWIPWSAFRATYRGRVRRDVEPLDRAGVRGFGIMCRRLVFAFLAFPFVRFDVLSSLFVFFFG